MMPMSRVSGVFNPTPNKPTNDKVVTPKVPPATVTAPDVNHHRARPSTQPTLDPARIVLLRHHRAAL